MEAPSLAALRWPQQQQQQRLATNLTFRQAASAGSSASRLKCCPASAVSSQGWGLSAEAVSMPRQRQRRRGPDSQELHQLSDAVR